MTTSEKLRIADNLERLLQIAIEQQWDVVIRRDIMDSIATLRSPRTVVLEYKEMDGEPAEANYLELWRDNKPWLYAPLPDLGEVK